MGNYPTIPQDVLQTRHVVIIGGGYGGVTLASNLKAVQIRFTLVDPKDYFHHTMGVLRVLVEPEFGKKVYIDYVKSFGDNFLKGRVTDVNTDEKTVTVDGSKCLNYTHLVFAVGSRGSFPCRTTASTIDEAAHEYNTATQELAQSRSVVLIEADPVAIQLAGEIAEKYKDEKTITLISSEGVLGSPVIPQHTLRGLLDLHKIEVILNEKVTNLDEVTFNKFYPQTVVTSSGRSIEADIFFTAVGWQPETSLTERLFKDAGLLENGRVKVDEYLRIEGYSNVFAIGDSCNTKEDKMATHAQTHGVTVAETIIGELRSLPPLKYKPSYVGIFLSFGRKLGIGVYNGWNLPSWIVSMYKYDLSTARIWKLMGQIMPE